MTSAERKLERAAIKYQAAVEKLEKERAELIAAVGDASTTGGMRVVDIVNLTGWSRPQVAAIKSAAQRKQQTG